MGEPRVAVVIVAAGRGERAGAARNGPKQYQSIGGEAVLTHTLRAFVRSGLVDPIITVIRSEDERRYRLAAAAVAPDAPIAFGGENRQQSVRQGLLALAGTNPDIVLIHDAARPFVDRETIRRVIDSVGPMSGALPAVPVADTLKRVGSGREIAGTVDRSGLFAAQTPQGFPYLAIASAHEAAAVAGRHDFTDDAAIAEWSAMTVKLVEGSLENVKLTSPDDIERADRKLRERAVMIDVRTGNGYDVHQLVPGDHVTLCGVRIEHDMSLSGHSDADVGLHALTDALLATCGAGDIGTHFPPSEERWRGAASHIFVRRAVEIVIEHGGRIANADITLICEAPKVAPHRDLMRQTIADMTGLQLHRVSVKATTNETIGFIGRREGIAAIATASVVYGDGS